jgi:hypothetical protein
VKWQIKYPEAKKPRLLSELDEFPNPSGSRPGIRTWKEKKKKMLDEFFLAHDNPVFLESTGSPMVEVHRLEEGYLVKSRLHPENFTIFIKIFPEMPILDLAVTEFSLHLIGPLLPWTCLAKISVGGKFFPALISEGIPGKLQLLQFFREPSTLLLHGSIFFQLACSPCSLLEPRRCQAFQFCLHALLKDSWKLYSRECRQ